MKSISYIKLSPWAMTFIFLLANGLCFFPNFAHAAVSFGDIGNNITENSKGVAEAFKFFGYASGVFFGVCACFDFSQGGKTQGKISAGLIKFTVAVMLVGFTYFLGSGSATFFGSDQTTGLMELGL